MSYQLVECPACGKTALGYAEHSDDQPDYYCVLCDHCGHYHEHLIDTACFVVAGTKTENE